MFFLSRTILKKIILVVAICYFHMAILCSSLKYFWVYALQCYMKFRLLHFNFSGILPVVCIIFSDVEAWKCACVVALWQFCDKTEYSSYSAGRLACALCWHLYVHYLQKNYSYASWIVCVIGLGRKHIVW
jgi:hypothetical protein